GQPGAICGSASGRAGSRMPQPVTASAAVSTRRLLLCTGFAPFGEHLRLLLLDSLAPREESPHHYEEQWHEEYAEECARDHAPENTGADRTLRAGAGSCCERKRQHAHAECQRRHQDRAQSCPYCLHG